MAGALAAGCGAGPPGSAQELLDRVEAAGAATCETRREPVPDVVTCDDGVEGVEGEVTAGLTDTPLDTVTATAESAAGPWIVGDGFVVITYGGSAEQAAAVRDAIGSGDLYVVEDGEAVPLASEGP